MMTVATLLSLSRDQTHRAADQNMEDSPAAIDDAQDLDPPAPAQPEKEATPEETVTVAGGRRRGRRRVMKKKTMKDEEGYLGKFSYRIASQFWGTL